MAKEPIEGQQVKKKPKLGRAITVSALMKKKFKTIPFEHDWERCMGRPGSNFKALIMGDSGNGKTTFTTQFCKMLASLHIGKVAYNSLEEGESVTMQDSWNQENMNEVARNIILLDREPIDTFISRINHQRSIRFAVIDSVQMSRMSNDQYDELKKVAGKRVALIFISHVDGKLPKGALAKDIRYDADIKIFIEGFVAMVTSRYGKKGGYVIWQKEAENYWGAMLPFIVDGKSVMQSKRLSGGKKSTKPKRKSKSKNDEI